MRKFTIHFDNREILVEGGQGSPYILIYPDNKRLMINNKEDGVWYIEERSGEYWSAADVQAIGKLITETEQDLPEDDDITGLPVQE